MSSITRNLAKIISVPLTTLGGAYAANQVVGGLFELPEAVDDLSMSATLMNVTAVDQANQKIVGTLVIFGSKPTGTYSDQAVATPSAGDYALVQTQATIPAVNYTQIIAAAAIGDIGNLWKKVRSGVVTQKQGSGAKSRSLWGVFITGGAPTYGAGQKLTLQIGINQD